MQIADYMNHNQRVIRQRRNAAGFSVIEVLVAIALLVVGIVAVLELFPPGFVAINRTKDVTLAQQAANALFEDLKQERLDQTGIIASQYSPCMDDTDAALNLADIVAPPDYDHNINSERIIGGETARIPSSGIYTVDFGPIDMSPAVQSGEIATWPTLPSGATASPANALTMFGSPWTGTQGTAFIGTSHGPAGILSRVQYIPAEVLSEDQPQYLIDNNQGAVALPMEQSMNAAGNGTGGYIQVVQFSVVAADGNTYSTTINWDPGPAGKGTYWDVDAASGLAEPLWFSPNSAGNGWFNSSGTAVSAPTGPTQLPWVAGSAVLGRNFAYVAGGTGSFTSDPYQFTTKLANIAPLTGTTYANPGVLAFNPTATALRDGSGKPPIVKITYWAADWHVINEIHVVNGADIRLNLSSVQKIGDSLTTTAVYNGMLDQVYPTVTTPEIYIVDMDSGQELRPVVDFTLDNRLYSTGVVTLISPSTYMNARLKIYYRPRGNWSINVLKSPAFYLPNATLNNAGPAPADTLANAATYQVTASGTRLLFPYTDVGKMVEITGVHVTNGATKSVINDAGVFTITAPDATMMGAGTKMGYVELGAVSSATAAPPIMPSGYTIDTSVLPAPIDKIAGASVTIRVVYYEQAEIRHHDFVSFLPPGPAI